MSAQGYDVPTNGQLVTLSNRRAGADRGGAGVAQGDDPLSFLAGLAVGSEDSAARGRTSGKPGLMATCDMFGERSMQYGTYASADHR